MASKISILSFNCFGVPLVSPRPAWRMAKIAEAILDFNPDLVLLQEVFRRRHKKLIANKLSKIYPYTYLSSKGLFKMGGGLANYSKIPLNEPKFINFLQSGIWRDMTFTDKIARKGFTEYSLHLEMPLKVFHTHLTANYQLNYIFGTQFELQKKQLHQLARSINVVPLDQPCLIAGDLNVPRESALFNNFLIQTKAQVLTESDQDTALVEVMKIPKLLKSFYHAQKIDYLIWRGPKPKAFTWKHIFEDSKLSDHLGIWAEIEF